MKYNRLTNVAIFVLAITAVFQTGKLWLGNTDSHNFFYSLYSSSGSQLNETNKNYIVIKPEKTVVGYGNRKFNMLYSENDTFAVSKLAEDVIRDVFASGKFVLADSINWSEYIEGKAVIMKYPFSISSKEYMNGYGINNKDFAENVKSINHIVVVPSGGNADETKCYFIDSNSSDAYLFTVGGKDSATRLYNAIQNMQYSQQDSIDYISTVQSGMNIFDSIYVPQWQEEMYSYNVVTVKNPFEGDNGEVDRAILGESANNFFDNYVSGEDAANMNDVYTFSKENVVVKYYENGILEYYNYDIGTSNTEQSLSSAYTISENFVKKDRFIKNDIFLAGVETRNEGLVFCYDYSVDNVPVRFSEKFSEETGMSHAIEVVVSNDNIKRYKRYMAYFEPDENVEARINVDMISAWDDAIMKYTGTDEVTSVSDLSIGYLLDGKDQMFIKWFTSFNGITLVGETYK